MSGFIFSIIFSIRLTAILDIGESESKIRVQSALQRISVFDDTPMDSDIPLLDFRP